MSLQKEPHALEAKAPAAHQVVAQLKVADEALFGAKTLLYLLNPCNATTMRDLSTMNLFAHGIAAAAADLQEAVQTVAEKPPQSAVRHETDQ